MIGHNIDDTEFMRRGVAGAFAYGVCRDAPGDGERALWTVAAPLGITPRPRGKMGYRPPFTFTGLGMALDLANAVIRMYPELLTACGMTNERLMWEEKIRGSWRNEREAAREAYYGNWHNDGRLDIVIHAGARALGREDFIAADMAWSGIFCSLDPIFGEPCPGSIAQSAGHALVRMTPVLGERAWNEIERLAAMTRGEKPTGD